MHALPSFLRAALLMSLLALAACGSDEPSSEHSGSTLAPLAFTTQLDRGPDLAGPDDNVNGVRDDVEQWIHLHDTLSPSARNALLHYAHLMQQTVLPPAQQMPRALELARQQAAALACLMSLPEISQHAADWSKRLRQITANTERRIRAYLAYSAALDGQSWSLPLTEACHEE